MLLSEATYNKCIKKMEQELQYIPSNTFDYNFKNKQTHVQLSVSRSIAQRNKRYPVLATPARFTVGYILIILICSQ